MNGNDLLVFEEKNPELQAKFLEEKGYVEENVISDEATRLLESQEYWDYVQEEYNMEERQTTLDEFGI